MLFTGDPLRTSACPTATAVAGGVLSASCLGSCGMEMRWAVTARCCRER